MKIKGHVSSTKQTQWYCYNIVPLTFHVYGVFGQKTCIYTIFDRSKGICTAGQCTVFCWPFHDVLYLDTYLDTWSGFEAAKTAP